jgi:tRNA pseudouridine55 synthase
MDGLINFWKPLGLTSAKTLERVRYLLGRPKAGHAGTLDPLAEGVLLICLGRGTKLVEKLMGLPKVYRVVAALDVTSASFDREQPLEPVPVASPPNELQVRAALAGFVGEIMQTPPSTSAVKIRGRPAYKLHRAGKEVTLLPRPTRIYWIHLHRYVWPALDFEVACGRGTYVRALIRDVGAALGVGGCLTQLTRTAIGPFRQGESWTLAALGDAAASSAAILSLDHVCELLAAPLQVPESPRT